MDDFTPGQVVELRAGSFHNRPATRPKLVRFVRYLAGGKFAEVEAQYQYGGRYESNFIHVAVEDLEAHDAG